MRNLAKNVTLLLCGAAIAATLVLACSDDAVTPVDAADAATCDCPAAEPPLAGRIVKRTQAITVPANGTTSGGAGCMQGETILGGGCTSLQSGSLVLKQSGVRPDAESYDCSWSSTSPTDVPATATAVCLQPAP